MTSTGSTERPPGAQAKAEPGGAQLRPRSWIRASLLTVSISALAVAAIGALLVYLVDRDEFSNFGTALWWSVVTVGTVGYGDIVPTSLAGRFVAAVVIIFSMGFFPVLTGLITTLIMRRAQQPADAAAEQDTKSRQAELLERLAAIDERLTDLDERLARHDERAR